MTIAQTCLLVAVLLPFATAWTAKAGAFALKDNHDPRGWSSRQSGWRARAVAAQANGFEALPLLIAGLFVAWQREAAQSTVDALALAFVGLRLAYIGLYIADQATLRSLVWTASVGCVLAMFFVGR
ncbi:MAG: MAPEG family protein [Rhizobacter sp.]|jgi:uncharacterized MAPEG superfamily protein